MKAAVIISSHIAGLGVIRALGSAGVPVVVLRYEAGDMGHVSKYVRQSLWAPHPEEREAEFVQFLLDAAPRLGQSLLIPTSDTALCALSRNKSVLERHYVVACTDWEVSERFIDKKHTYAIADAAGVPVPRTTVPHCREDVERFAAMASYPCVVKPCQGHRFRTATQARWKWVRADGFEDLLENFQKAAAAGMEVMFQEYIPGEESAGVNYNSYFWGGQELVEFTARKIRNYPPDTGSPCVVVSQRVPDVLDAGRRLLKAMDFCGYSCAEFKRDERDGVYKLIEVNGRHNLSSLLAPHCGINFPLLQYRHLVDGHLPSAGEFREGVHWIDISRDLASLLWRLRRGRFPSASDLGPYLAEHVFAVFDWRDPRPAMTRTADAIAQRWSRYFRRTRPAGGPH